MVVSWYLGSSSYHILVLNHSFYIMATAHEVRVLPLTEKEVEMVKEEPDVAYIEGTPVTSGEIVEDALLEKRLNRKFDTHILPWLFGIWYVFHSSHPQVYSTPHSPTSPSPPSQPMSDSAHRPRYS